MLQEQQEDQEQYSCLEEFFMDSCRYGDYEDAIGCFEDNVDLLWIDFNQNNCIHMVAANGHKQILLDIINYAKIKKIDIPKLINHQNEFGCTPLHWAVLNNQLEIIQILLDNEANIQIQNAQGITSLDEAIKLEKNDVIELFSKRISLTEDQQKAFDFEGEVVEEEEDFEGEQQ